MQVAHNDAGLFAVGECACISINGANRLGSNSLTKLLVFGKRAGIAAAEYAKSCGKFDDSSLESQTASEQARIAAIFNRTGGSERIAAVRRDMHNAMETGAGIYRHDVSLAATCETLAEVRKRLGNIQLDDRSNCFNTDLTNLLELENMVDIAEAVSHSARQRTESRGSHQRTDFPERDDQKFLKHSMAYRTEDGTPRIEYLDVVITKWPPAERVYGEKTVESKA